MPGVLGIGVPGLRPVKEGMALKSVLRVLILRKQCGTLDDVAHNDLFQQGRLPRSRRSVDGKHLSVLLKQGRFSLFNRQVDRRLLHERRAEPGGPFPQRRIFHMQDLMHLPPKGLPVGRMHQIDPVLFSRWVGRLPGATDIIQKLLRHFLLPVSDPVQQKLKVIGKVIVTESQVIVVIFPVSGTSVRKQLERNAKHRCIGAALTGPALPVRLLCIVLQIAFFHPTINGLKNRRGHRIRCERLRRRIGGRLHRSRLRLSQSVLRLCLPRFILRLCLPRFFIRLRALLLREKTAFQFRNLRPVGALLQTFRQPSAAAFDLFHGPDDGGKRQRMSDVLSLRRQLQADTGDLIKAPLRPFILLILEGQLLGNTPDAGLPPDFAYINRNIPPLFHAAGFRFLPHGAIKVRREIKLHKIRNRLCTLPFRCGTTPVSAA